MGHHEQATVSTIRGWIALFVLIALAIIAGSYGYSRLAAEMVRKEAIERLTAVGELKANLIAEWRKERLSDAFRSASAPFFRVAFEEWLSAPAGTPLPPAFDEYLALDAIAYGFADVLLLDASGQILASIREDSDAGFPETRAAIDAALRTGESAMSDFILKPNGEGPLIDTVAVIPGSGGEPLGFIVLRSDANDFFYPLLAMWPTPSESAEAALVRKDGDDVLFLNVPRHGDSGVMTVRLPLEATGRPAVQAVLGRVGIVEGWDYRDERVLADLRPIQGTPWHLVAKIDARELLAEARFRMWTAIVIALLCVALTGGAIAYTYRLRQFGIYGKLYGAEQSERRALEEVRTTLYSIGDAVITTGTDGRIRRMNPVAEQLTGWQESAARGKSLETVFRIVNESTREPMLDPVQIVLQEGAVVGLANGTLLIARDGAERPIADSGAPIHDETGAVSGVVLVFRDQTEERAAERALRESEERFRNLYENAAVGILIHDGETGAILDANRKAIEAYGLETLEQLQRHEVWLEPPYSLEDAMRIIRKSYKEGPQRFEWRSKDVNGVEFWEDITTFTLPMDGTRRIVSVALDITERKRAEEALALTTTALERFFFVALDLLCIADSDSTFLKLNDAWESVLGYPSQELIGKYFMDFVHPEDREATLEAMRVLAERQPVDAFVNRYRSADGSYRFIEWRATCPDGNLIFAAARDITARREAEIERQRLLTLLTQAESIASMGAWELDVLTGKTTWTDEIYAIYELEKGGQQDIETALEFYHPEDRPIISAAVQAAIEKHEPYNLTLRFQTARGNFRWVRTSGIPTVENGRVVRLVGMFQDITQQQLSEEALERELHFSQELIANMADGFVLLDPEGVIVDMNPAFSEMTGFTREDLIGTGTPHLYWPPEELETIMANFNETLELRPQTYELIFQRKNGERFPVLVSPSYLQDAKGKVVNYFATIKDMSERKQADEERERLMSAIEQSSESIIITAPDGTVQYVNPAFERITGYSREEALGENPRILKSGEQDDAFYEDLWNTIARGETWHGRLRNKRKDGALFTEDATISPVRDHAGNIVNFVAVKRDIGREEELEAQLRQSQKMDAVGRLAGGIAHDFNNMLGVILGHAEMALEQVEPDSPLVEDLQQIQSAGKRSADLTRQLLSFARRQTIAPKVLNLNATIESTLAMLKPLIGEDITIVWRPGEHVAAVRLDPSQADQILINLAVNARDAIAGIGEITIETRIGLVRPNQPDAPAGIEPGRYAVLSFRDNGCGMDAPTLEHIFEPFFSTKAMGRGTGLGLATIYGIVKQNEGAIAVRSAPGQGSTFEIYLPEHDAADTSAPEPAPSTPKHEPGTGTILLVEDEAPLLKVNTRFLERLGYIVLPASDPFMALEIARGNGEHIDLLLTDVVMPGMTGREVWEQLHAEQPRLKCLFVSGYTADIIAEHGVMEVGVHFLQKPFTMQALAEKVREVLGEARTDAS